MLRWVCFNLKSHVIHKGKRFNPPETNVARHNYVFPMVYRLRFPDIVNYWLLTLKTINRVMGVVHRQSKKN